MIIFYVTKFHTEAGLCVGVVSCVRYVLMCKSLSPYPRGEWKESGLPPD